MGLWDCGWQPILHLAKHRVALWEDMKAYVLRSNKGKSLCPGIQRACDVCMVCPICSRSHPLERLRKNLARYLEPLLSLRRRTSSRHQEWRPVETYGLVILLEAIEVAFPAAFPAARQIPRLSRIGTPHCILETRSSRHLVVSYLHQTCQCPIHTTSSTSIPPPPRSSPSSPSFPLRRHRHRHPSSRPPRPSSRPPPLSSSHSPSSYPSSSPSCSTAVPPVSAPGLCAALAW